MSTETLTTYHVAVTKGTDVKMTSEELVSAFHAGMVKRGTMIWREGLDEWRTLEAMAVELDLRIPREEPKKPTRAPLSPSKGVREEMPGASMIPPTKPEVENTAGMELLLLVIGFLMGGYFLLFYSTLNGTVHNLGLLQNRALGAGASGVLVIVSVLIAGFNGRAGKAFSKAIMVLVVGVAILVVTLMVFAGLKSRGVIS